MGDGARAYRAVTRSQRDERMVVALDKLPHLVRFLLATPCFEAEHSGGPLLRHLAGTYELLAAWHCDQALCNAGLFHSIYGTDAYSRASLPREDRGAMRELIGARSEKLAWVFCEMRRDSFVEALLCPGDGARTVKSRFDNVSYCLDYADFCDLAHLTAANLIEQRERVRTEHRQYLRDQLMRLQPYVNRRASRSISSVTDAQ